MRSNYKSDTPRDKSNVSDCNGCRKTPILLLVKRSTKMYMIYIYDHQDKKTHKRIFFCHVFVAVILSIELQI